MGEPLRPPSWSSNDPQPLIEPLSIKLLPPRYIVCWVKTVAHCIFNFGTLQRSSSLELFLLLSPKVTRLLIPRVSLDYLLKQRRRGQSAGAVLEFKDYGQEKSEEEEKEQKHNNSTGMFGLMNRNELMQSYTELLQKQADVSIRC